VKVFLNNPKENWIVDRIRKEWYENNPDIVTESMADCDVLWVVAPWQWTHIPFNIYSDKKVVCTIHHIVPEKFDENNLNEFKIRDQFVDAYHVPNKYTENFVSQITDKPIYRISYWYNPELWNPMDKLLAREDLGLPAGKKIIGSFQRDTEGSDLISPKLEKGPDLFCDYVEKIKTDDTLVLLGGWRRQYVISRLRSAGIPYRYYEKSSIANIRKMYAACDLYVVSSRQEGGPQALFEASAMNVPIISTKVGLAEDVLNENCIIDIEKEVYDPTDVDVEDNFNRVRKYDILVHKEKYLNMLREVVNGT